MTRRRRQPSSDPFAVLGLRRGATAEQIRRARKRLAKQQHPDVGGSESAMQRINEAAEAALADRDEVRADPPPQPTARRSPPPPGRPGRRVWRDHPSFTIEALPMEAFEALLIAGAILGRVADDEPPYRLDVLLDEPADTWCRLELVPDGGGSTVSLTVAGAPSDVGVLEVRDRFVAELNLLDWADDGPHRRQPW